LVVVDCTNVPDRQTDTQRETERERERERQRERDRDGQNLMVRHGVTKLRENNLTVTPKALV